MILRAFQVVNVKLVLASWIVLAVQMCTHVLSKHKAKPLVKENIGHSGEPVHVLPTREL